MNKKAQLDKAILFVPVLIILILAIAIFYIASLAIAAARGPEVSAAKFSNSRENILLQKNQFTLKDDSQKTLLVLEAVALFYEDKIHISELEQKINQIASKENKCFYLIAYTQKETPESEDLPNVNLKSDALSPNIRIPQSETKIKLNKIELSVIQYFGGCDE